MHIGNKTFNKHHLLNFYHYFTVKGLCFFFIYAGIYVWNDIGQGQFDNKPSYLNWDREEPNDKHYDRFTPQRCDGEDCVQINIWNGVVSWFDLNCDIVLPFICEKSRGKD